MAPKFLEHCPTGHAGQMKVEQDEIWFPSLDEHQRLRAV
jgi:hypothetical protein